MIAIQNPHNKTVRAVYCHWDGYLEHNGAILARHYAASPKANNLIALGDLSSLRKNIGIQHSFDDRTAEHEDSCTFYTRDRGETAPFQVFKNLKDAEEHYTWSDYYYCFKYSKSSDYTVGEWFYKRNGGRWLKLAPAIAKLNKDECAA
jgi:hypothetical protein